MKPWTILAALAALMATLAGACGGDNSAPSLAILRDQRVIVGETLTFVITADDADGDRLDFKAKGLPDGAELTPRAANEAVLVWSPLITDTQPGGRRYTIDLTVDDGRGGTASQSFGLIAYPTFGAPTFVLPAGLVVNLATQDAIEQLVTVKDDDSTEVELEMIEGPDGARLSAQGPKQAYFYWRPDDNQRAVSVHRAVFRARDEAGATATHTLTLVLLNAEKQAGCQGQPPSIEHEVPADQTLAGPLAIEVSAQDAQSQVQSVVLRWTRGDPNGTYTSTSLQRVRPSGPTWRASVELGSLPPDGTLVHYYLVATDNDDPTGVACDQSTRFPKTGYLTAAVYPAGANGCLDDSSEPDDTPGSAPTLAAGTSPGHRLCGPGRDLVAITAPEGTTVVAAATWSAAQGQLAMRVVDAAGDPLEDATQAAPGRLQVVHDRRNGDPIYLEVSSSSVVRISYTLELAVEATRCENDPAEPDSTPDLAKRIDIGSSTAAKICPSDADWFRIPVPAGKAIKVSAAFDHRYGDLDLELYAADGTTLLGRSASEKSLESITWSADTGAAEVLARVYGVGSAFNSYTLLVDEFLSAGCPADGLGDNASPSTAAVLFQGVYEGFRACSIASDWFSVDLNGGETLSVLLLADAAPHVSVKLYRDPSGEPIAVGLPDEEGYVEIEFTPEGPGRLYYEVSTDATLAGYSLLQDVTDPPGACQPDRFEPNGVGAPVPLEPGIHTWLRHCGGTDVDVFALTVPDFTNIVALTSHDTGRGLGDLELRSPNGTLLETGEDPGDGAYLEIFVDHGGTYTLSVRPFDVSATLGYDLAVFFD